MPGCIAQSAEHLTQEPEVSVLIPGWPHTSVSPSAGSKRAVASYWRKYVHKVLRRSKPARKSVGRLTKHPDMILAVYHGCKQQQQLDNVLKIFVSLLCATSRIW